MRIISGRFRSRVLLAPEDDQTTRPITDRVKQSLFDILTPYVDGAIVYDCFAGTGSMGLESLSRGAAHATFFEADRSASMRLKKNIASLGVEAESTVVGGDLFKWFAHTPTPANPASLIFLDPPYRYLKQRPHDLLALAERLRDHLAPGGLVIFRHDAHDQLTLPPLHVTDTRTYGQMTLQFLTRDASSPTDATTPEA